jgi:OmcA/MtrC family decaheme c-type cytochrome
MDQGAEPCLACHGAEASSFSFINFGPVPELVTVVHGYHSSVESWADPVEAIEPHVTYPTYMGNCSVCHAEAAELTAANSMPVSGIGCLSCHGTMDNAFWDFTAVPFHLTNIPDPNTFDCASGCHEPGGLATEKIVVTDFHNYAGEDANGDPIGIETERGGQIVNGVDTSVEEGKKFVWEITGVADDGTNLEITWQATYDTVGVDPCNDVVGANAPVFFAGAEDTPNENSLRIYRNYAQGEDFILGEDDGAPGQPTRADVTTANTVCASNVATTTIPVEDVVAERGRLMIGGKPLVQAVYDPAEIMQARVPTPTFDWLVGAGGAAPDRRAVVDTAGKCLKCHVGSLYQHGGDRVDNVDACLLCHNSASNEQSVRVGLGVDASEAYDGKVGETFEMKTMLHRIHSAGATDEADNPIRSPYVIYRNRGIYAWAVSESELPNWPGTGDQVVFGSDFGTPPDRTPGPVTIRHNFHATTYPRGIYDCAACHDDTFGAAGGAPVIPDQTKAMANTTDAGNEACDPGTDCDWSDQLDDTLQGAATTACVTCHTSGAAKGHAYQNSWVPTVFPDGRQTIIDAVK